MKADINTYKQLVKQTNDYAKVLKDAHHAMFVEHQKAAFRLIQKYAGLERVIDLRRTHLGTFVSIKDGKIILSTLIDRDPLDIFDVGKNIVRFQTNTGSEEFTNHLNNPELIDKIIQEWVIEDTKYIEKARVEHDEYKAQCKRIDDGFVTPKGYMFEFHECPRQTRGKWIRSYPSTWHEGDDDEYEWNTCQRCKGEGGLLVCENHEWPCHRMSIFNANENEKTASKKMLELLQDILTVREYKMFVM